LFFDKSSANHGQIQVSLVAPSFFRMQLNKKCKSLNKKGSSLSAALFFFAVVKCIAYEA